MLERIGKLERISHTKTADFRKIILAELERTGRSRYWLAHAVSSDPSSSVNQRAVYRYLAGDGDTTGSAIASAFAVLGIRVKLPK